MPDAKLEAELEIVLAVELADEETVTLFFTGTEDFAFIASGSSAAFCALVGITLVAACNCAFVGTTAFGFALTVFEEAAFEEVACDDATLELAAELTAELIIEFTLELSAELTEQTLVLLFS